MSMKLQSTGSTDEWVMGTFRINARGWYEMTTGAVDFKVTFSPK